MNEWRRRSKETGSALSLKRWHSELYIKEADNTRIMELQKM